MTITNFLDTKLLDSDNDLALISLVYLLWDLSRDPLYKVEKIHQLFN